MFRVASVTNRKREKTDQAYNWYFEKLIEAEILIKQIFFTSLFKLARWLCISYDWDYIEIEDLNFYYIKFRYDNVFTIIFVILS